MRYCTNNLGRVRCVCACVCAHITQFIHTMLFPLGVKKSYQPKNKNRANLLVSPMGALLLTFGCMTTSPLYSGGYCSESLVRGRYVYDILCILHNFYSQWYTHWDLLNNSSHPSGPSRRSVHNICCMNTWTLYYRRYCIHDFSLVRCILQIRVSIFNLPASYRYIDHHPRNTV